MLGKKDTSNHARTFFLALILSFGLFVLSSLFIPVGDASLLTYVQTWTLIASRGTLGNTGALLEIDKNKGYTRELLGDSEYIRGNTLAARSAFEEAIMYNPDERIIKKLTLLSAPAQGTGSSESGTNLDPGILESTYNRIENDAMNREKYFGKSESYSDTLPVFETAEKEIIDW